MPKTPPLVTQDDYFSTTQIKHLIITPEDDPDNEFWVIAQDYEELLIAYYQLLGTKTNY